MNRTLAEMNEFIRNQRLKMTNVQETNALLGEEIIDLLDLDSNNGVIYSGGRMELNTNSGGGVIFCARPSRDTDSAPFQYPKPPKLLRRQQTPPADSAAIDDTTPEVPGN